MTLAVLLYIMASCVTRVCSGVIRGFLCVKPTGFSGSSAAGVWRRLASTTEASQKSENGEASSSSDAKDAKPASDQNAAFEEEKKKLTEQLEELRDKYTRALAETENVRQRLQKQIQDAKLFGIQGFCKDLLEVADVLNKATESMSKEDLKNADPTLRTLYEGLQMTETQLHKVFTRHGLVQVNPAEGEKFDPNFHEALFQQPLGQEKTPGSVAVVSKVGYKLHNRTLRPALVGVFASQ